MQNAYQFILVDLNISDIERLRSENDALKKKVEGMEEALRELQKNLRKLEDEEAEIRKKKVSCILNDSHFIIFT
jgi:predicted  nucleic acid-binding Zn-ribbon protein